MIKDQRCGDCIHWVADPSNKDKAEEKHGGQCRGITPQIVNIQGMTPQKIVDPVSGKIQTIVSPTNQIRSMFPAMLAIDIGCHKFERLIEPEMIKTSYDGPFKL